MSGKPIFVATHPRACSTAFERVFMTCRDTIQCVHEPFGDAFYYGPERLSRRFEDNEKARLDSGFSESTYKTVWDRIEQEALEGATTQVSGRPNSAGSASHPRPHGVLMSYLESHGTLNTRDAYLDLQGRRVFIKDIIHYLFPPDGKPASIAPSLLRIKRGVGTDSAAANANGVSNGTNGDAAGEGSTAANGHAEPAAHGTNGTSTNGIGAGSNGYAEPAAHGTNGTNGAHAMAHKSANAAGYYPYATEPEPGNPTVVPKELLSKFHFTFLIRDPHYSAPSYYRCTQPPLVKVTGWHTYDASEAGYDEVRRMFDYLRSERLIGPGVATRTDLSESAGGSSSSDGHAVAENGTSSEAMRSSSGVEICVVDADDLLDKPAEMIEAFCHSVGLRYDPSMLSWDSAEDQQYAGETFEKWRGFHDDAIDSKALKPRTHARRIKTEEEFDADWHAKFGEDGAAAIRRTVDANMADYLYMKQFAMKV